MSILMRDGERSGRIIPAEVKTPEGVEIKKPSPHLEVGDHIDVTKFTERLGKGNWKDPKTRYILSQEDNVNSGSGTHGGGVWKLKDRRGKRIGTVSEDGKIFRR